MPAWLQTLAVICVGFFFVFAFYLAWRLKEIHSLVNSRLSLALKEIKRLGGDRDEF